MEQHFIWGFYFTPPTAQKRKFLKQLQLDSTIDAVDKWESRFFWPDGQKVCLFNIPPDLLQLKHYKIKLRQDSYIINGELNIKLRKNKLHCKKLLQHHGNSFCYAKKTKIKLTQENKSVLSQLFPQLVNSEFADSINSDDFKTYLSQFYPIITLDKEVLIHQFTPQTRFELSRLCINDKHYLSLSVETHSRQNLEKLVKLIVPNTKAQSYTDFLNTL